LIARSSESNSIRIDAKTGALGRGLAGLRNAAHRLFLRQLFAGFSVLQPRIVAGSNSDFDFAAQAFDAAPMDAAFAGRLGFGTFEFFQPLFGRLPAGRCRFYLGVNKFKRALAFRALFTARSAQPNRLNAALRNLKDLSGSPACVVKLQEKLR